MAGSGWDLVGATRRHQPGVRSEYDLVFLLRPGVSNAQAVVNIRAWQDSLRGLYKQSVRGVNMETGRIGVKVTLRAVPTDHDYTEAIEYDHGFASWEDWEAVAQDWAKTERWAGLQQGAARRVPVYFSASHALGTIRAIYNNYFAPEFGLPKLPGGKVWPLNGKQYDNKRRVFNGLVWALLHDKCGDYNSLDSEEQLAFKEYLAVFRKYHLLPEQESQAINSFLEEGILGINKVGVSVMGGSSQTLTYWNAIEDLKEGDLVVVEYANEYRVAKVTEVFAGGSFKPTKWIVQKVDTSSVEALRARIEEASTIQRKLETMLEEEKKKLVFEKLAETNGEAKKLIDRMKELGF